MGTRSDAASRKGPTGAKWTWPWSASQRQLTDCLGQLAIGIAGMVVVLLLLVPFGCSPDARVDDSVVGSNSAPSKDKSPPSSTLIGNTQPEGGILTRLPALSFPASPGRLVQETERGGSSSSPLIDHRFLTDYTGQMMRYEVYWDDTLRFLEVNEGGSTKSLSLADGSLREHAQSFDEYEKAHDVLAGLPVRWEIEMSVDGRPGAVYRVEFPKEGDEITADYARILVDRATGVRLRENWVAGSEVVRVVTRRLVPATSQREALLSRDSVQASSSGALEGVLVP